MLFLICTIKSGFLSPKSILFHFKALYVEKIYIFEDQLLKIFFFFYHSGRWMSEQTVETTMPLGSNTVSIFKVCLFFFPNHIEIISYGAAIIFLNKLTFFSRQQGDVSLLFTKKKKIKEVWAKCANLASKPEKRLQLFLCFMDYYESIMARISYAT